MFETLYTICLVLLTVKIMDDPMKYALIIAKYLRYIHPNGGLYLENFLLGRITRGKKSVFTSEPKPEVNPSNPMANEIMANLSKMIGQQCGAKPSTFNDLLSKYEAEHDTKVIFINHEETSIYGVYSSWKQLDYKDAKEFTNIMGKLKSNQHITLVMNTLGGQLTSAQVIIKAIQQHHGHITVVVPHMCCSAGTLIALACDEIVMAPNAYCGPIDPQIGPLSLVNIIKFCENYKDSQSVFGDVIKFGLGMANSSMDRVRSILETIIPDKNIRSNVEEELLSGKYTHDTPIFRDLMSSLVCVSDDYPNDVHELYEAYIKK